MSDYIVNPIKKVASVLVLVSQGSGAVTFRADHLKKDPVAVGGRFFDNRHSWMGPKMTLGTLTMSVGDFPGPGP